MLNKRAQLTPDDVGLISFDRLRPDPNAANFTCVALANGKYTVKTIPPTFTYSPGTAYNLSIISEFDKAIPYLENALNKEPHNLGTLNSLGTCYMAQNMQEKAMSEDMAF